MTETISGAEEEIAFWRGVIDRHCKNPENSAFRAKLDPERPLQKTVLNRLRSSLTSGQSTARVLDVGCGPLSTIGKKADGLTVDVVGLDPLADDYQALFQDSTLVRPHESVNGFAERASEYFGEASFDYVHAENSLDHCQDAGRALSELQRVCKPDAVFFFRVFVNEGEHNHYAGFHQWNFDTYNEKVIFWRPGEIHFIDEVFRLPVKFWYDEQSHGPRKITRKYLNCEIHNTDFSRGFADVGPVKVRQLPEFSCLVLKRTDQHIKDARTFVHFGFEDGPRQVATLVWPDAQDHYILPVPKGRLKNIKIGQSRPKITHFGEPAWDELWTKFVPNLAFP